MRHDSTTSLAQKSNFSYSYSGGSQMRRDSKTSFPQQSKLCFSYCGSSQTRHDSTTSLPQKSKWDTTLRPLSPKRVSFVTPTPVVLKWNTTRDLFVPNRIIHVIPGLPAPREDTTLSGSYQDKPQLVQRLLRAVRLVWKLPEKTGCWNKANGATLQAGVRVSLLVERKASFHNRMPRLLEN